MCAFTGGACEREDIQDVHVGEPCRSCCDEDNISPEIIHQQGQSNSSSNGSVMVDGHPTSSEAGSSGLAAEDNSADEQDGESNEIQYEECRHGEWILTCDVCLGPVDTGRYGLVDHEEDQGGDAS